MEILYEDQDIIVAVKPAGIESQSRHNFEADMVSEIKRHIHKLSTAGREPYVGVIHRLDKPVGGVMVYAKTKESAAVLSKAVQEGGLKKHYLAVVCGKPVENAGNYVDYLLKDERENCSRIVDKGITGAKRAELNYRELKVWQQGSDAQTLALLEIELLTGRHHQIRVQLAGHGMPIYGDAKYGLCGMAAGTGRMRRKELALFSHKLSFVHPKTGERMSFTAKPQNEIFNRIN